MTNMQAAIGVAQMERIDSFLERRADITRRYSEQLAGIEGITLPPEEEWAANIYWLYTILLDEVQLGITLDEMMEKLKFEGIETRPVFAPLSAQPPYPKSSAKFPVSMNLASRGLSLPTGNDNTIEEVDRVCKAIRKVLSNI
jgi:perosamine synthetase